MKRLLVQHQIDGTRSPPRAGAWIETCGMLCLGAAKPRRPPARGRGLKLSNFTQ